MRTFNLLMYVYGELFLHSLNRGVAEITTDSWKIRSWINILNWLEHNKHISNLTIQCVAPSQHRITYVFNYDNVIYLNRLRYLQRLVNDNTPLHSCEVGHREEFKCR